MKVKANKRTHHFFKYSLVIIILCLLTCDGILDDNGYHGPTPILDIYDIYKQLTPLTQDTNGYYHFPYNPSGTSDSDYGTVKYFTEVPTTLVSWTSPDEFCIDHLGTEICEPIICCSTYSGTDGYGQQLFYVSPDSIGDTLNIYGNVSEVIVDSVFVIIE